MRWFVAATTFLWLVRLENNGNMLLQGADARGRAHSGLGAVGEARPGGAAAAPSGGTDGQDHVNAADAGPQGPDWGQAHVKAVLSHGSHVQT